VPYKSVAQERYFNANRAKLEKQGVDVDEWNAASKGKQLPTHEMLGTYQDHKNPASRRKALKR